MRILQLCNKPPYPPLEGGSIAMNNITQGLLDAGHELKVVAISSFKNEVNIDEFPKEYLDKTKFESVFVDLRIKPKAAFINLFSKNSYHVQRFISLNFENKLKQILGEETFDIVQLETLFMTPYIKVIRQFSDAKIVLRSHNIEHLIWKRVAKFEKNALKRWYINRLATTLSNYEKKTINQYDGIASISKKDIEYFIKEGCIKPITDITFGIDVENFNTNNSSLKESQISLFHIGAMNWIPNQEGIKWFLVNVWQDINAIFNNLELYLAGRKMPEWLLNSTYPNVIIKGEVEDSKEFVNSHSIMIVPLFSGSGLRIKIIEAMALGKTVISTTIGAEGINYTNNENIIIADSKEEFISAITTCIDNPEFCKTIGLNASKLIKAEHNNRIITQRLVSFYEDLILNPKVI
ncbi:MAG: glycosyltransferase family 4 protein [Bacteroidota bacterium]